MRDGDAEECTTPSRWLEYALALPSTLCMSNGSVFFFSRLSVDHGKGG